MLGDHGGAFRKSRQRPVHGGFGKPSGAAQPLAEAYNSRKATDDSVALARWDSQEQSAVVGAEVKGRKTRRAV
jgi:hypothetical protein